MNITKLVGLHLETYLTQSGLDPAMFSHLARQIAEGQDLQDRRNFDGHVTSSFALLNPEKTHVLVIFHLGFQTYLFPGGHYEGQMGPRGSALRELEEETGFPSALVGFLDYNDFTALDLDTHEIPERPSKNEDAHWHHDFLYLGVATGHWDLVPQVEEVAEAKWIPLDEAANLPDERMRRAMKKIIKLVNA